MQYTIKARFASVDESDRAVARLRGAIAGLRADISAPDGSPASGRAPVSASLYYPWRLNMTMNEAGNMAPELGSRVLYTSDLMGLPLYRDGETELRLTLDAKDVSRARALLVNLGAKGIQVS
jgi:hypothetical protein